MQILGLVYFRNQNGKISFPLHEYFTLFSSGHGCHGIFKFQEFRFVVVLSRIIFVVICWYVNTLKYYINMTDLYRLGANFRPILQQLGARLS